MSSIISLADAGYRQFGPLPSSGDGFTAELAAQIGVQHGDYEAAGRWVRRRGRGHDCIPNAIDILDVLDRNTELTDKRLQFAADHFDSAFASAGEDRFFAESETLVATVEDAKQQPRWRAMYRLTQALAFAGRGQLRPLLRDQVAWRFFECYPEGRIVVLRYDANADRAATVSRMYYAAAQAPLPQLRASGFDGLRTLQNWHFGSMTSMGPLLVNLFLYLFYPFIGGFRGGPPGLEFVFLFEPAEVYRLDLFPRNWLAAASAAATFGGEDFELTDVIHNRHSPKGERAAHQRYRFEGGYTVAERLELFRWYVGRVNRLLYELSDVANFTEGRDPQAPIDPIRAFEHQITVDRLIRKTLLALSLEEVGTAKSLVFEVAELLDALSLCFGNHANPTEFFKKLFNTAEGPELLRDRLAELPAPFGAALPGLADQVYHEIEEKVIASVWLRSKVTPGGVMVRDKDLATEECHARPDFVAELMRCYRNAQHGYFTAADRQQRRPSRFLFLADGDLPVEMTALPALWWLAYLADPGIVGWKQLPVGTFD